jgi:hypothetical protein
MAKEEDEPLLNTVDEEEPQVRHDEANQSEIFRQAVPYVQNAAMVIAPFFIVGGVVNFMVFCVLWVQDYDVYEDIRNIWTSSKCLVLMRACSCTCCMLAPLTPCWCPARSTSCSLYCPIEDPNPPLDAICRVPGRVVRTMDSYWKPGQPTCIMKYHNSMLVEYTDQQNQVQVASIYEVSSDRLGHILCIVSPLFVQIAPRDFNGSSLPSVHAGES